MSHYLFSVVYMAMAGSYGQRVRLSILIRVILIIFTGVLVNIPVEGLSVTMLTYSFLGEISFFLLVLCVFSLLLSLRATRGTLLTVRAVIFIFCFGLVLYLSVLNLIPLEFYYQSPQRVIAVCCAVTILAYFAHNLLGVIYFISLFAYCLSLVNHHFAVLASGNLFDYFIDVPLWLFSVLYLLVFVVKNSAKFIIKRIAKY